MTTPTDIPSRIAADASASVERLRGPVRAVIDTAPGRPVRFRVRTGLTLAAVLLSTVTAVATVSFIVYARQAVGLDVASSAEIHLLTVLGLLVLLVLSATWVALTRGQRGFGAPVSLLAIAALVAVPAYAALVLVFPVHAADPPALAAGLSPWGARCLAVAAVVGGIVLAAFPAALHRAVPVASRWRGGAIGATAGLWSGIAVFIFCPANELGHLLIGHVAPIAAFMLAGLIVAPRTLSP